MTVDVFEFFDTEVLVVESTMFEFIEGENSVEVFDIVEPGPQGPPGPPGPLGGDIVSDPLAYYILARA